MFYDAFCEAAGVEWIFHDSYENTHLNTKICMQLLCFDFLLQDT